MHTTTTTDLADAIEGLKAVRIALLSARLDTLTMSRRLSGARLSRAEELGEKVADCIAHCERLAFCVVGDLHAEQADGGQR